MTASTQTSQAPTPESKPQDNKEYNFRALEAKYQKELERAQAGRLEAEKRIQELSRQQIPEDDDSSEPYVDHKKLEKKLAKFGEQNRQQTQTDIQKAVQQAREEAKHEAWLENNPDFYDVLSHAEKLAIKAPGLAKSILAMPDTPDRQKLVYQNIKELGLHKDPVKEPTIQDKVNSNRKGAFYQPSGVGTSPYSSQSDFSQSGQKNAYEKMQELKNRLRI